MRDHPLQSGSGQNVPVLDSQARQAGLQERQEDLRLSPALATSSPDQVTGLGEGASSIALFEGMLHECLSSLFEDLIRSNWYIREHEIVNLFTFGHLVPMFQVRRLDLMMIGIEFPVMQADVDEKSRFGARKDLVIWPEGRMTLWKDCELAVHMKLKPLRDVGRKPFAVIEWKVVSRIHDAAAARKRRREHEQDIAWLKRNLDSGMMTIGFAVIVEQCTGKNVSVKCVRISDVPARATDFLSISSTPTPTAPPV